MDSRAPDQPCRRRFLPEVVRDWGWKVSSSIQSHWITVNGWRIHCRSSRTDHPGAPVVLVHGLVISSLYLIPLAECLSRDRVVHAPDQPGFGRSEGPARALDVHGMARALIQWMNAAGIGECHLVANSLGCQIATVMAVEAPERFLSVTLIGPTVDANAPGFWSQAWRILCDAPHEPMQLWINHAADQVRAGCRRIWAMIFHMLRDRIEERLPRVNQPTLVVHGKHDTSAPEGWVRQVASLLPAGQLRILPGWHCVHYTHPALTAETIREFITSVDRSEIKT
ncbi:MAG: alpha/beta hydrolase [Verrucomicrobiaceae bacterium]|nr:MAG: alpha/beta hydrolase [Verrucomicrobiaceae bacterium]